MNDSHFDKERFNRPFPTTLRRLMKEKRVKQDAVAKAAGRTRQTISVYMKGIQEPNHDVTVRLAQFFGVSVDYLLGNSTARGFDSSLKSICDSTGLEEENVRMLLKANASGNDSAVALANELLKAVGNPSALAQYKIALAASRIPEAAEWVDDREQYREEALQRGFFVEEPYLAVESHIFAMAGIICSMLLDKIKPDDDADYWSPDEEEEDDPAEEEEDDPVEEEDPEIEEW